MRRLFQLDIANPVLFEEAVRHADMQTLREMLPEADERQAAVISAEIQRRETSNALCFASVAFTAIAMLALS